MAIRERGARLRRRPPVARRGTHPVEAPPERVTTQAPAPSRYWRTVNDGASALNILAGIWLIIAPWVLGYSAGDPRWNDVVFGAIVAMIAFTRDSGAYRAEWLSWLNASIGVWLFIAGFTIDQGVVTSWNDVILGIVVFLLAISSVQATSNMLWPRRSTTPRFH